MLVTGDLGIIGDLTLLYNNATISTEVHGVLNNLNIKGDPLVLETSGTIRARYSPNTDYNINILTYNDDNKTAETTLKRLRIKGRFILSNANANSSNDKLSGKMYGTGDPPNDNPDEGQVYFKIK